ncbi:MAG: MmgE/PrpD family protein [Candidatus Lambdaproteobacteria bacterium]|nr:MmgE/PrpD family protein [Candidatus Lambdaproteobacteria bacterium]
MTVINEAPREPGLPPFAEIPPQQVTRRLARFFLDLRYEDIPAAVLERAKQSILDQLGCQIAFAELPWSRQVYRTIAELGGRAESTVVGYGLRTNAENAAFANSAFAHGHELDDTFLGIPTHPGAVIVPAVLAVGERERASGRDLLLAMVVGHEVMLRVGLGVARSLLWRGHHTPPAVGPFGVAAAAGRLIGLDDRQFLNALGIAGSFAAGLLEYTRTGSSVKRIHCAIPAQAGIRSAHLARAGMTGPASILEGEKGFCKVFVDDYDLDRITAGMGEEWTTPGVSIKGFDCCHLIHAPIEATLRIKARQGFDPAAIERIVVKTSKQGKVHCGVIVEPDDVLGAQFSFAFSLALTLLRGGNGFEHYVESELRAPELLALARKVVVEEDAEFERVYPEAFAGGVECRLKGGATYSERVLHQKGHPQNPLSHDEVREKFQRLAQLALLPAVEAAAVLELVERLETVPDASALLTHMVKPSRGAALP